MRFVLLLTLLSAMVAQGCKKSRTRNFPNVQVEQYVYLNNPSNYDLSVPGGWVYHEGGYKGIIIVRRFINNTQDDFAAFDRACPAHYSEDCSQLVIMDNNVYAQCKCHNEKYVLFDGSPSDGATESLIQYRTDYRDGVVYVYN